MKKEGRWRFWIAFGACALLSMLLRFSLVSLPLERDEGGYAYVAQRWLLGEVPYKRAFDQKPPGIDMAYAAILGVLGESPSAIHWGAAFYGLGALALLILLGTELLSLEAGLCAGLFFAFLTADRCVLGSAANTEIFMALPLIGALLAGLAAVERESPALSLLTGALAAAACLFKQSAAPDALFYLLLLGLPGGRRRMRILGMLAGAVFFALPIFAYFAWAGALREFYDCVIGYNLSYGGKVSLLEYPVRFWFSFQNTLVPFWPVYALAAIGLAKAEGRSRRVAGGWLLASALGVAAGGYFRDHYFIQALPAVALLAGIGAVSILKAGRKAPPWALALAVVFYGVGRSAWYYLPSSPVDKARRLYGANPFPESVEAARFIEANSLPDDGVFVFGSEPQILFYAHRKSSSRYIYSYPLVAPFSDALARQRETLEDIRKNSPRFIVTSFVASSFLASIRAPREIFDGLGGLLKQSYRIAAVTRFRREGPPELIVGDQARELWRENPMWYNTRIWGSLAVWERAR